MSTTTLYRRIIRRETHSPRSVLAISLALILAVLLVWVGVEIVLALLGLSPLLVAPLAMFSFVLGLVELPPAAVVPAAIGSAIVGLLLVIAACAPGRRARHELRSERAATVVDNEVIASALARHAARVGQVSPDDVTVSVSHRRAVVHLTPTSGVPVDREAVAETVASELASYGLHPSVTPRVRIAEEGRVGA